ncbi:probable U3 small nucleolar RNA-associated protein 11 [Lingula anatina]|nr:probable U3 small nucleolar RNA-associated protein 11 [Lingula anatina]|eukprot:XP_013398660.1 probable U3 small nucleolar RNA-associated protein 11 [Lingula anatina]
MVNTRLKEGVHQNDDSPPAYSEEQLKLMQSQDLKYINYKRSTELKKIEKLKGSLHLLEGEEKPKNKHTFFVDSKKEAKSFDVAKRFNTHPSLLGRTYNRPTLDMLKTQTYQSGLDQDTVQEFAEERKKKYKELSKRIERERHLHVIAQKMEMKKLLMDKKARKKKVADETKEMAAVYKWMPQRKR